MDHTRMLGQEGTLQDSLKLDNIN